MSKLILVVDDDNLLRRSLAFSLERAGYRVLTAGDAMSAVAMARAHSPDLILLDIAMPEVSGLEALPEFRKLANFPVIFITARCRELDEVLGLELGADDYITKPFDNDILLAHIRAVMRRAQPGPASSPPARPAPLVVGDLEMDPAGYRVLLRGTPLCLSPREFNLLYALALEAGQALSSEELLARVWGAEFVGETQGVYVYIRWLREKLEVDPNRPRRIVTVRNLGYKLVPQEG